MRIKIPFTARYLEIRSLAKPANWLVDALTGGSTAFSGVNVTPSTALRTSAVYACVRVLAETLASLPLPVYRRLPGGGKERAVTHYLYPVLHDAPNPEMTSFELREALMGHLCLWGNAYAEKELDRAGRVRALWPLRPDRMQVGRLNGELVYQYTLPDGQTVVLGQDNVLHIRGLSSDGIIGYSPIQLVREAIGLGLAAEEFGARLFSNGAHLGGIVEYPGKLKQEAIEQFKKSIQEAYQGLSKSHRLMILEEGLKYHQVAIPPEDAQFLETRKFQVNEIARIFRVPPHMLADLERATFSNIEHQSIDFVVHTIRPWLVRWEQAIRRDLFLPGERDTYFAEFLVDGLLRGDVRSRYEAYAIARQWGWMSADDIRELENMNPLPDGQGKLYLVPLNMLPADQAGQNTEPPPPQENSLPDQRTADREQRALRSAATRRQIGRAYRKIWADATKRIVRREKADILKKAKSLLQRDAEQFLVWLERFYAEAPEWIRETMAPVVLGYVEAVQAVVAEEVDAPVGMTQEWTKWAEGYNDRFTEEYIRASVLQLQALMRESLDEGKEPYEVLEQRLNEWEEKRPDKVAMQETVNAANAIAVAVYRGAGIIKLKWRAAGKSCPYCNEIDGKVVSIDTPFVGRDEVLESEDGVMPLNKPTMHPPLHRGCDCVVTAET